MPLSANAIVDVVSAKRYIKLTGTSDDTLIEDIINGVSTLFEKYCNCKFINIAVTEVLDGNGSDIIIVNSLPVSLLTSVKTREGTTWTAQTLTDFVIASVAGMIKWENGTYTEGFQNIELKYTAGYGANIAALPDDLKLAGMKQCQFFYERDSADFSDTFEEGMIVRAPSELLSPTVRGMLSPYYKTNLK
jgi:uncharacterized phiE125 gp8 family phage protein